MKRPLTPAEFRRLFTKPVKPRPQPVKPPRKEVGPREQAARVLREALAARSQ